MDQQLNMLGMLLLSVGGYLTITWIKNALELKEENQWLQVKWQSIITLLLWLGMIFQGFSLI